MLSVHSSWVHPAAGLSELLAQPEQSLAAPNLTAGHANNQHAAAAVSISNGSDKNNSSSSCARSAATIASSAVVAAAITAGVKGKEGRGVGNVNEVGNMVMEIRVEKSGKSFERELEMILCWFR